MTILMSVDYRQKNSEPPEAQVESDAFPLLLFVDCLEVRQEARCGNSNQSCQKDLFVKDCVQRLCGVVDDLLLQAYLLV